ncbi:cobinamide kinase [Bacillus mangrovi]|uniref:Adenosylcobinamide kinase n=1 Tax=Metabacillus mangrovi TaxID=1491830 RepID=A0A7X2V4I2_9BACI|nr:bifunctional adenosylcobinamide kinase/adenosylcobinamide-phosphate guanylyltransferase [Metabacillus mangrovi]MTH53053.1 cobinamide kinase [Metabacillus mangrovi]
MLIFVTGGVRSGKTAFAEKLAAEWAGEVGCLHYVAAGRPSDEEMKHRIERHREARSHSALEWTTHEQPRDLQEIADRFTKEDVVVLDCVTTWLNNEMFSSRPKPDLTVHMMHGMKALERRCKVLIAVSNELFFDAFSYSGPVYEYMKILGRLHVETVSLADSAYLVESGIPVLKKGGLL